MHQILKPQSCSKSPHDGYTHQGSSSGGFQGKFSQQDGRLPNIHGGYSNKG